MMYFIYVLRCSDNSLYTGYTNDVAKRLKIHQAGTGAKYTRARLPVTLVYSECFDSKSLAMRREAQIKKMTRTEKDALIRAAMQQ